MSVEGPSQTAQGGESQYRVEIAALHDDVAVLKHLCALPRQRVPVPHRVVGGRGERLGGVKVERRRPARALVALERAYPVSRLGTPDHRLSVVCTANEEDAILCRIREP